MLLLDRRVGSSDLYQPLQALGIPVELATLDAGDVAWLGRGPDELPVPVGIEIKRVGDLLQSITSGRLSGHQLPKLVREYTHVWLVVEGRYRSGAEGLLEVPTGPFWGPKMMGARPWTFREVEAYLTTLEVRAGLHVRKTHDRKETAALIAALFKWWTGKAYDEHKAHVAMHGAVQDAQLIYKPTLTRRIAAELPGVGLERSGAVADHFPTVRRMVDATEEEWQKIPGIGKGLAKKITDALGGK